MGEPVRKISQVELVWDKKRILIGIIIFLGILAATYLTKTLVLDKKESKIFTQKNDQGRVAGTTTKEDEFIELPTPEEFKNKIEGIKREISTLTPEDVKDQEPVKEILQDLEELRVSTEAQLVGGAKNAVCEQAKKIFCSQ